MRFGNALALAATQPRMVLLIVFMLTLAGPTAAETESC